MRWLFKTSLINFSQKEIFPMSAEKKTHLSVNSVVRLVTRRNAKTKKAVKALLKEVYRELDRKTIDRIFAPDAPSPETILRERRKVLE